MGRVFTRRCSWPACFLIEVRQPGIEVFVDADDVGADADDLIAFGDEFCEGGDRLRHRELAVFSGGLCDASAGAFDVGMVEVAGLANAMGEIARAKVENVETFNRGDLIDAVQSFGRFDLKDDKSLPVPVDQIIIGVCAAELAVGAAAVDRPLAQGVKASPFDDLAGFVCTGDMRDHDASGVGFEGFDVIAVASFRDANDGVHVVEFGRSDLVLEVEPIVRDVFIAHPSDWIIGEAYHFDDTGISGVDFHAGCAPAVAENGK